MLAALFLLLQIPMARELGMPTPNMTNCLAAV